MSYASGRYAWAICDTCGLRGRYVDMVTEQVTNKRVHVACRDTKVVNTPIEVGADRQALRYPRPDVRFDEPS